MADIAFTGWGRYYQTGTIDINAAPPLLPDTAQILFPPISGQTDVDTYVNWDNVADFFGNRENAVIDHHQTVTLPFAPCDIGNIITTGFGPALNFAWSRHGGKILASRVTCEGFGHVLGVPTMFRYHLYILHDPIPMLIGLAILAAILLVGLDDGAARRLTTFSKPFSPGGATEGAVQALVLFGVVGSLFVLGLFLLEKNLAAPGQTVSLPSLPGFPGIAQPSVSVSPSITTPLPGGGRAGVGAGVSVGGGGGGGGRSRRGR